MDHVEDADVDEHTRVWLQSQAATAADPNMSPGMRPGAGVHASGGMQVPLPRPRDPSMTVLPAGIVAQGMAIARRHGGVSDLGTSAVEEAASISQALIDSWDFDTLALSSEQLRASVIKMFDATGLFEAKLVTEHHLAAFLIAIEARYSRIASYHTFAHAVDVTHTLYRLLALSDKRLRVAIADKFALLVAALAHDLGHPGVSNAYLVATRHALTLTHGDSSTLERFHIASLYELCAQDPEADVFASCDDATWRGVRRTIIGCILHTDMVHHGPLLSRGELCVQLHQEAGGGGLAGQDAASAASGKRSESAMLPSAAMALPLASEQSITAAAGHGHAASSPDVVPFASPDERMLLFSLLLHAADISNPAKPWLIASKWADCVNTEFWAQGDAEQGMGLPVAPLNDRHAVTSVSAGQINFMEFVVAPLFAFLAKAVPETKGLLVQLLHNRDVLGRAYEDEAAAAAAAGNTDLGAWDVSRMRNRQRAFREKYEPIAGLTTHGRVSDRSDASTARRGNSNSPNGSIVGDMPAAEAMAARLRAALHASNNRVAPRGGNRPPLSSSRRGSGMSSRSGSIGSSLGGDVGHLQADMGVPSTSAGQWIHRGSGAVRHLLSEVSVLAVPGGRDVNDGSALRSGSPDSVGMSQDMALSKPPRRGMFSGGSPPAPDGAVRHEDVAASRSVPSGRLTTRHNSYAEGDDVESGAGQPRQSSASRRGSFPPSNPVVL
jgi:3'5'-cyclic nucleotide phosphodiesterase